MSTQDSFKAKKACTHISTSFLIREHLDTHVWGKHHTKPFKKCYGWLHYRKILQIIQMKFHVFGIFYWKTSNFHLNNSVNASVHQLCWRTVKIKPSNLCVCVYLLRCLPGPQRWGPGPPASGSARGYRRRLSWSTGTPQPAPARRLGSPPRRHTPWEGVLRVWLYIDTRFFFFSLVAISLPKMCLDYNHVNSQTMHLYRTVVAVFGRS